jgi:hypothetical protein
MVSEVMALWLVVVWMEGDDWPRNRKALVALEPQKETIVEKDCLLYMTLQHPSAQPPVRAGKNNRAPTDPRNCVQGRVGDPPSVGDQELRHGVSLRTT